VSSSIRDIAEELSIDPGDIIAIVNQLSEIDLGDAIQPAETPAEKMAVMHHIDTPSGSYENLILTEAAVTALREQFHSDRSARKDGS
jgi:hypothetical protein